MAVPLEPDFVQAVRDAADLLDLASDHTRLERRGKRHLGLCPFHKEKTPSFSVDAEQGLYYCFGCGAGGDAIGFHMQVTGDDFSEAVENLARRYGVPLPRGDARRASASDSEAVLVAAQEFFVGRLERSPAPLRYLERRRISEEWWRRFGLGYAPDGWQDLHDALGRRFDSKALMAAGLLASSDSGRQYDRFRHRLMFPIRLPSGRIVGFGGRTLGDDRAKYVNTPETPSFRKGTILYGLDRARPAAREGGRLLLVEGYFDVLAAAMAGFEATVASMGTALTEQQAKTIARYADEVIVGYDGDRAGEEASRKALPLLLGHGLTVRRARFPAGQDPDSLRLEQGDDAVRRVVESAVDFVELEIERLPRGVAERPREVAAAIEQIRPVLDAVGEPGVRQAYQRQVGERLGVRMDLLGDRARALFRRATGPPPEDRDDTPGRGIEERVLGLLLAGAPLAELPPAEAFWSPVRRTLFEALREARRAEGDDLPGEVARLLPPGGEELRLLARLQGDLGAGPQADLHATPQADHLATPQADLPESPAGLHPDDIGALSERLVRRHRKQQLERLSQEIREAERAGDGDLLEDLIQQRTALARAQHRKS